LMGDDAFEQPLEIKWDVTAGPDLPDLGATVWLRMSIGGQTEEYWLDARTATQLSNALIVQAEKAMFVGARKPAQRLYSNTER
jgi:hypothetical protein